MELTHPFLRILDSVLAGMVTAEPLDVWGKWSTSFRRTHRSELQRNSGAGPFVDVEDRRWNGTLTCGHAVGGMGFLVTPSGVSWRKGPTIQCRSRSPRRGQPAARESHTLTPTAVRRPRHAGRYRSRSRPRTRCRQPRAGLSAARSFPIRPIYDFCGPTWARSVASRLAVSSGFRV
jgi:hypothetical protein